MGEEQDHHYIHTVYDQRSLLWFMITVVLCMHVRVNECTMNARYYIDVYACALLLSVGWSITHALYVYACTAVHGGLVHYGRLPAC